VAGDNLCRTAQVTLSGSTIRSLVETQGRAVLSAQQTGALPPSFTAADCTDQTVISGTDGVMVPLVTEQQKRQRRQTEAIKRNKQRPDACQDYSSHTAYGARTDLYWARSRLTVDWSGYGSPGVRCPKWEYPCGLIAVDRWNGPKPAVSEVWIHSTAVCPNSTCTWHQTDSN